MFSIIAAIGKNRELGKGNQLIFHIKDDMNFFRDTTTGHPVLMGHNTWDSLPAKLTDRENLVVSHHPVDGADQTISDLSQFIHDNIDSDEEIFVIGGGMLYLELLPYARHLYLTEIDATFPSADTFFPAFNKSSYTKSTIKKGTENGLNYSINQYIKTNPQ